MSKKQHLDLRGEAKQAKLARAAATKKAMSQRTTGHVGSRNEITPPRYWGERKICGQIIREINTSAVQMWLNERTGRKS